MSIVFKKYKEDTILRNGNIKDLIKIILTCNLAHFLSHILQQIFVSQLFKTKMLFLKPMYS